MKFNYLLTIALLFTLPFSGLAQTYKKTLDFTKNALRYKKMHFQPYKSCSLSQEIHWNWNELPWQNIDTKLFPDNFQIGCADSDLQSRGLVKADGTLLTAKESHWVAWQEKRNYTEQQRAHRAHERQDNLEQDIALLAKLGANSHRFSINLSKIVRPKGGYNDQEFDYYKKLINECRNNNIEPIVCLYHHDHPMEFEKLGAFEKKENIPVFLNYIKHVVEQLKDQKIKYWLTFNEPVGFAMAGYIDGRYPPAKPGNKLQQIKLTGHVVLNMLRTHIHMAHIIKQTNPQALIGIAKIFNPIDPYRINTGLECLNPRQWLDSIISNYFGGLLNEVALEYFKTGHYNWGGLVKAYDLQAPKSLDFIGVNYYTHSVFDSAHFDMVNRKNEIVGESDEGKKPTALYPEGLYRAIKSAARLNKPIFITEVDFPTTNVILKAEAHKKYLYVIAKALQEGHNIIGMHTWASMGNYSWASGNNNKYGWYNVDFNTQQRTFNPGYQPIVDLALLKKI